ncbi:MAG: hypothetical protein PUB45_04955 [Bacteroidales bacterium]|nr:hypothetical protein [Bacteroidales bacterium]
MRKIFAILAAASIFAGCDDNVNEVFSDYFVCIKDENESETSTIKDTSNELVMTYYITLVAPVLEKDVVVSYEIVPGKGLKEGVDYKPVSKARSVTLARGVTRMPVRIIYLKNPVDPEADNTLTITLTGVDRNGITLGYPGPASSFVSHTVTKVHSE